VTSVEYPDPDKNEPRGKFFRFKMEDLTNIVGNWACVDTEAYKTQEIKGGAGSVVRSEKERDRRWKQSRLRLGRS